MKQLLRRTLVRSEYVASMATAARHFERSEKSVTIKNEISPHRSSSSLGETKQSPGINIKRLERTARDCFGDLAMTHND